MQVSVRINPAQVLDQRVRLVLADIVKKIILTIEIRQLYSVEIIKVKLADAKTRQRDGNIAAKAAEADDSDACVAQCVLLRLREAFLQRSVDFCLRGRNVLLLAARLPRRARRCRTQRRNRQAGRLWHHHDYRR